MKNTRRILVISFYRQFTSSKTSLAESSPSISIWERGRLATCRIVRVALTTAWGGEIIQGMEERCQPSLPTTYHYPSSPGVICDLYRRRCEMKAGRFFEGREKCSPLGKIEMHRPFAMRDLPWGSLVEINKGFVRSV